MTPEDVEKLVIAYGNESYDIGTHHDEPFSEYRTGRVTERRGSVMSAIRSLCEERDRLNTELGNCQRIAIRTVVEVSVERNALRSEVSSLRSEAESLQARVEAAERDKASRAWPRCNCKAGAYDTHDKTCPLNY